MRCPKSRWPQPPWASGRAGRHLASRQNHEHSQPHTHLDTNLLVLRFRVGVKIQNADCSIQPHPKLAAFALAVKQAVRCKERAGKRQGGKQAGSRGKGFPGCLWCGVGSAAQRTGLQHGHPLHNVWGTPSRLAQRTCCEEHPRVNQGSAACVVSIAIRHIVVECCSSTGPRKGKACLRNLGRGA